MGAGEEGVKRFPPCLKFDLLKDLLKGAGHKRQLKIE